MQAQDANQIVTLTTRITRREHLILKQLAERESRSLAMQMRHLIREAGRAAEE